MIGDFPDTEEAQYMVDTVSGKVFRHFPETFLPPAVVIFCHHVPVVCRHTPILSVGRECVWWCSSLSVHVEVIRFYPCFYTCTADTDRNISFDNDSFASCIVGSGKQLHMQFILQEVVECYFTVCSTVRIT